MKRPYESEQPAMMKMGKTLVAARDLEAGQALTAADLAIRSPAGGLDPTALPALIGAHLVRDLKADDPIRFDDITRN